MKQTVTVNIDTTIDLSLNHANAEHTITQLKKD